ncbi:MAG: nucleoside kinase [Ruminococcaceae bacterium]|nr:nucleoside kinase [Oscillospiraceae bacterium]
MEFGIEKILTELENDTAGYVIRCESRYESQIREAAQRIHAIRHKRPIVLLAGPSGSGKTTTAIKLTHELKKLGLGSVSLSMDNYFLDYDPETAPRAADGSRDMESPFCIDLQLMGQHFRELTEGKEVVVPAFDFGMEKRDPTKGTPLRLGEDEVAIFEGINALNDAVTQFEGVFSFKLFVSAASEITDVYSSRTTRLIRRMIRDYNFRSASPEYTLYLWKNVLEGERLYIEPNRGKADMEIDTFLPYEPAALRKYAMPLIESIPEMHEVWTQLSRFPDVSDELISSSSLLREFIGGSEYVY